MKNSGSASLHCRLVDDPDDIRRCMKIRRDVFVDEQRLFSDTDCDEYDEDALHIAAFIHDTIVGTVRVYRDEDGVWWGGRLAVVKKLRGRAGKALVRKAEGIARQQKATRLYALILIENSTFFKKMGWRTIGDPFVFRERMHQKMEASLEQS